MGLGLGVARGSRALPKFRVPVWPGSRVTLGLDGSHLVARAEGQSVESVAGLGTNLYSKGPRSVWAWVRKSGWVIGSFVAQIGGQPAARASTDTTTRVKGQPVTGIQGSLARIRVSM